ncbi:hypothetical protein [Polaromonas sp. JS666]|uniref:hypothetical protein n=1 Tax=Polaromonas sp. (strain JS666 / ATCC BAA-500) TaxID=296591 RepID=UPI0000464B3D|nr:hypothetical protein [Polaromonas sp. JS666]ABE45676.1 hypothetical protein Bpro_3777 [Polaromonas sp. JS666]
MPLLPIVLSLAQFAPSILRFFGAGEASAAVADKVASVAQSVTGASTPQEALDAIKANAQLQADFARRVIDIDAELEGAYLADRQDARKRDIEFLKAGKTNSRANAMVLFDALGLIACLVVLAFFRKDIPGEVVGLVSTIASIFGLCLRDAHQFEFGSSRGSREKDDLLANMQQGRK